MGLIFCYFTAGIISKNKNRGFQAQTEEAARIEALNHEIIEVQQEIDRKIHYTRQLEHVLLRLKKNQLKFDAHMVGMEGSVNSLQKVKTFIRKLGTISLR